MSARDLLNHLADNCDSLDNTDAVDIRLAMSLWWRESPGVLEFILSIERVHKKASHTNLLIKNAYMSAITTLLIQSTQAFPVNHKVWYKLTVSQQT